MIHNSSFTIVGLGNPGEKYEKTHHNAGRMIVRCFGRAHECSDFSYDKYADALISKGNIHGVPVTLVLPETFMNESGSAVAKVAEGVDAAERLIVVHDDLDIPLGTFKTAFERGSAGHRGVDSVIAALGTNKFTRLRIGIAPVDENGTAKKPLEPERFVLQKFSPEEREVMQEVCERASNEIISFVARERKEI